MEDSGINLENTEKVRKACVAFFAELISYIENASLNNKRDINAYCVKKGFKPPFPQAEAPRPGNADNVVTWLGSTAVKVLMIASGKADSTWVGFDPPPGRDMSTTYSSNDLETMQLIDELLDNVAKRDVIRGNITGSIARLIEKINADDSALRACYRQLLNVTRIRWKKDMDILHSLLTECGAEPSFTLQEVKDHKMWYRLKLKRRIKKELMKL